MKRKALGCTTFATMVCLFSLLFWRKEVKVGTFENTRQPGAEVSSARVVLPASVSSGQDDFLSTLPTNQSASIRGTKPFVLTSPVKFQKSLRLAAESLGARTIGILSPNKLLVEVNPETRTKLLSDSRFTSADEFLPREKISNALAAFLDTGVKSVEVALLTLSAADRQVVLNRISARGGKMLEGCINEGDTLRVTIPSELVTELAACGDVRWLERFVRPQILNDMAVQEKAMNVAAIWKSETFPEGLSGAGQIITTSDSGIDLSHEDLTNQIMGHAVVPQCYDGDGIGHGTHTAGSIVGDGTKSDGKIRGVAWGAKLWAWFCGKENDRGIYLPASYDDLFLSSNREVSRKSYLHSASWGNDIASGVYDADCRNIDAWTWNNPEYLPVFSAGNSGSQKHTIGSPAAAKNVLAVGATQNLRTRYPANDHPTGDPTKTASFSSRGPCADGRIKPDVAAPGVGILSTRAYNRSYSRGYSSDGNYAYDCGTSMSCPLTAGAMALIREWLMKRDEFADENGKRPTAALMKAIVTGGAVRDQIQPDENQGWGRVNLKETLFPSGGKAVKLIDRLQFKENAEFSFVVETTNAAPLDVQLVWTDAPVVPGNGTLALVNDLDLTVAPLENATKLFYGNGGASPDRKNNVESVRIASATANKYLVSVSCESILYDYKEGGAAALYIRGAFDPETIENVSSDRVRIARTGANYYYSSLDAALDDAQEGDTLEVLFPVRLRQTRSIPNGCTICCSNESIRSVSLLNGASLIVTSGRTVTFKNVSLLSSGMGLCVESGAVAAFAGMVKASIDLRAGGTLKMSEPLDTASALLVKDGRAENQIFGEADIDLETAKSCVNVFANVDNDELGGIAEERDGKVALVWGRPPIPESVAYVKLIQDGTEYNYRTIPVALKYVTNDAELVVLRDCSFAGSMDVSGRRIVLRSKTGATISPQGQSTEEQPAELLVGTGGELVISNLVFSGFSLFGNKKVFACVQTNGILRLQNSRFEAINNTQGTYGAVKVEKGGTAILEKGSAIDGAISQNFGGGVYLALGGELDLFGGRIVNCLAYGSGGGVYAVKGSVIKVADGATVWENFRRKVKDSADSLLVRDNINVPGTATSVSPIQVTGDLTGGKIGIGFNEQSPLYGEGGAFAALDALGDREAEKDAAAAAFSSDGNGAYVGGVLAAVSEDGKNLVWVASPNEPGTVPEDEANIRVDRGGKILYYAELEKAFAGLTGGVARVTLLNSVMLTGDATNVVGDVTLESDFGDEVVTRSGDCRICVEGIGNSLTLTNVTLNATNNVARDFGTCPFVSVNDGAALVMASGSQIENVQNGVSTSRRTSAAVSVLNGTFEMNDNSFIVNCGGGRTEGAGGGVIIAGTNSVFRFKGGVISGCSAETGGGVQIDNASQFIVSGAGQITNNVGGNLYVARLSDVILADVFTGSVGWSPGLLASTSVFGRVSANYVGPVSDLASSAARFYMDDNPSVTGCIATNETEALLVWSSSVADGKFVSEDGTVYGVVEPSDPPVPPDPPEPEYTVTTNDPAEVALAFSEVTRKSATAWTLVLTNLLKDADYALSYTDDLRIPFTTGEWFRAAFNGPLTNDVIFNSEEVKPAYFWRAHGRTTYITNYINQESMSYGRKEN